MHRRHRLILAMAALAAVLALSAVPVAAGGVATAEVTAGLDEPPVAGEDREVHVLLLQHGVTPVDFGSVVMTAVQPESGESFSAEATSLGNGAWAATLAFPSAGDWEVSVTHNELATPAAMAITVADAGLALPPMAAPVAGMALLALVLVTAIAIVRRQRPGAPATGPAEPSLPRT